MIPFKKLPIDDSDMKAVEKVMHSKSLGMGKTVYELEEEFADYVGSKYAVAVNSCTSAIYLSLIYRRRNEYIGACSIPSMTVPLVANTIIHSGTWLKFRDDTRWVGRSYELEGFDIIDSAHEVKKRDDWDKNKLVCYSFYPTKPVCSADGGMICTNDEDAVKWFRSARMYGRAKAETKVKNSWEYTIDFPGWKMNLSDIQAAIALNQLRKLPEIDRLRQGIVNFYNKRLGILNTGLYLYRINVPNRDAFVPWMLDQGIECGVHFAPLHLMK